MVFENLVLEHSHAGLFKRRARERNARLVRRDRSREENFVDLLLRVRRELSLRLAHLGHPRLERFETVDRHAPVVLLHITLPSFLARTKIRRAFK